MLFKLKCRDTEQRFFTLTKCFRCKKRNVLGFWHSFLSIIDCGNILCVLVESAGFGLLYELSTMNKAIPGEVVSIDNNWAKYWRKKCCNKSRDTTKWFCHIKTWPQLAKTYFEKSKWKACTAPSTVFTRHSYFWLMTWPSWAILMKMLKNKLTHG